MGQCVKLIDEGWCVVFDEESSYMLHKKTRKVIKIHRTRGGFTIDALGMPGPEESGFSGQALAKATNAQRMS